MNFKEEVLMPSLLHKTLTKRNAFPVFESCCPLNIRNEPLSYTTLWTQEKLK
jgi:hypothetical protein